MSESALFMFGGGVSLIMFVGVFLYGMYSFRDWSSRQESKSSE
jgi:hypothetical protein